MHVHSYCVTEVNENFLKSALMYSSHVHSSQPKGLLLQLLQPSQQKVVSSFCRSGGEEERNKVKRDENRETQMKCNIKVLLEANKHASSLPHDQC